LKSCILSQPVDRHYSKPREMILCHCMLRCACVFLGYSIQLFPRSSETSAYKLTYKGEWISDVISVTNDWLCVSLSISVPAIFHVSVDLVTDTDTKTVYTVDNVVGETAATDMLTVFEVQLDATQTSYSQLVVYVSEGTVIRNVDIQNNLCSISSTSEFVVPIVTFEYTCMLCIIYHYMDHTHLISSLFA